MEVILSHVSKNYGEVNAVDDIDLKVPDREFLTLLGPSGSGKTTVLRLIAGLEKATAGNIYIGERLVNDISPRERNVAMVFQSYALYPHMTVYENLAFPLKARKLHSAEIRKRVTETATILGMPKLLNRKPRQLSGGEQQRVALGRAIVRNPSVFLMDEPLSNLDAKLRMQMRAELIRLQRRLGTTLIYVTHDQLEAMTMSSHVAVMQSGKVVQLDTPENVFSRPADIFVAGFVGSPSMNFFNCSLVEDNGKHKLVGDLFSYPISTDIGQSIQKSSSGKQLVLGVRPAHVRLSKSDTGWIEAEVYAREPIGEEVIVDFRLGEEVYKGTAAAGFRAEIGDKIYVWFDERHIHVFERASGAAIV